MSEIYLQKVYDFCVSIFNSMTEAVKLPNISSIAVLLAKLDPQQLKMISTYLETENQDHISTIRNIFIKSCNDMLSDHALTLEDIPIIMTMIHIISLELNEIAVETSASLSKTNVLVFIKIIFTMICQMFLPQSDIAIVEDVINISIRLLETTIIPFVKDKPCFKFCNPK